MNRYKLTYRRSEREKYVIHLSSETLDKDGVEKKMMELLNEHGSGIALSDEHGQEYSGIIITGGHYCDTELSELKLMNVVEA